MTDSEVPQIDVHTLHDLLPSGIALVDVREADEWLVARVPGVPLVTMSELAERVDDVPSTGRVYLICASGARSHRVAEFLRARGVDAVNVAGGTNGWVEAGYEVESGPSSA